MYEVVVAVDPAELTLFKFIDEEDVRSVSIMAMIVKCGL
jgi:hypothetical protein